MELAVKLKLGEDLMVFPQDRELDAAGFVAFAIIKMFPCERRN